MEYCISQKCQKCGIPRIEHVDQSGLKEFQEFCYECVKWTKHTVKYYESF